MVKRKRPAVSNVFGAPAPAVVAAAPVRKKPKAPTVMLAAMETTARDDDGEDDLEAFMDKLPEQMEAPRVRALPKGDVADSDSDDGQAAQRRAQFGNPALAAEKRRRADVARREKQRAEQEAADAAPLEPLTKDFYTPVPAIAALDAKEAAAKIGVQTRGRDVPAPVENFSQAGLGAGELAYCIAGRGERERGGLTRWFSALTDSQRAWLLQTCSNRVARPI